MIHTSNTIIRLVLTRTVKLDSTLSSPSSLKSYLVRTKRTVAVLKEPSGIQPCQEATLTDKYYLKSKSVALASRARGAGFELGSWEVSFDPVSDQAVRKVPGL